MNENVLILSFSPQQQQNSSDQFNPTSSTLQLHSRGSAVENIYQIDGGGDGGEYEYCPWALKLRLLTRPRALDKKHELTTRFRSHSGLLKCPDWITWTNNKTTEMKTFCFPDKRNSWLCPTLEKQTTSPREHCCEKPALRFCCHVANAALTPYVMDVTTVFGLRREDTVGGVLTLEHIQSHDSVVSLVQFQHETLVEKWCNCPLCI